MGLTSLAVTQPLDLAPSQAVPIPDPSDVEAVMFLLGDAGGTDRERSPLLNALRAGIEWWSGALARNAAVSIVFLGDVVYPNGMRARTDPGFEEDSARLWNQIDLSGGPAATRFATPGFFLAGNHDWANTGIDEGLPRVIRLGEELSRARQVGRRVWLLPAAGEAGPVVRDLRGNVRLVFLDSHWFLQPRPRRDRAAFFQRLETLLEEAGDREVIFAAHHPYASAGPHGVSMPRSRDGGISYLFQKSGTMAQDLNSAVYADLLAGLRQIFVASEKRPLVFAGGHDHSLQVLSGEADHDPRFILVSGAGSKLTTVRATPGLVWGASQPGYMMLVFRKDDGVDLFVMAADEKFLECPGNSTDLARCMAAGAEAYEIVYSVSLVAS